MKACRLTSSTKANRSQGRDAKPQTAGVRSVGGWAAERIAFSAGPAGLRWTRDVNRPLQGKTMQRAERSPPLGADSHGELSDAARK